MRPRGETKMFIAKEVGKTEKGSTYVIAQDTPSSFHISVTNGTNSIYDYFENPPNLESLKEAVITLDSELHNNQYDPEIK